MYVLFHSVISKSFTMSVLNHFRISLCIPMLYNNIINIQIISNMQDGIISLLFLEILKNVVSESFSIQKRWQFPLFCSLALVKIFYFCHYNTYLDDFNDLYL